MELKNNKDIKYLGIPNICFSLTDEVDAREIEFKKQRIECGFDESETWCLTTTIANFIIPRLELYQKIANDVLIREPELINNVNYFLEAMKLLSRDESSCIWNDAESEIVENGLAAFPKIFMSLWW